MFAERHAPRALLFVALGIAVLLRAEYLRELGQSPFWSHLVLDARWHDEAARHLLLGPSPGNRTAPPPAVYDAFLAGLYALFGAGPVAPRVVQTLAGLALVVLTWRVALRTHGPRAARAAALLAGSFGMFAYFEAELLGASLTTFLLAAGTLLLLDADVRARLPGRLAGFAAGGACFGLAAALHAVAALLVPAAFLWAALRRGRRTAALFLLAGGIVPVVLLGAREFRPGGVDFFVGNNPRADGKSALVLGSATVGHGREATGPVTAAAVRQAERELGRDLTRGEVERYWWGRGLSWIRDHPRQATGLLVRKLLFFGNGYEIANNRDFRDQARRFTPILQVFLIQYSFLLPFALFGILRSRRGRGPTLLLVLMVAWAAGTCAFYVCSRFRVPSVPWVLPFAAAGLIGYVDVLRAGRAAPREVRRASALLVILFALTNGLLVSRTGIADVISERDAPFHRFNLAMLYEEQGDLDRAIAEYRATAGSEDPRIHLGLGNLLARTGRAQGAREEYRRVLRIAPELEGVARRNLGIVAASEEDWPEAIRQFERALSVDPEQDEALEGLAASYLAAGRFDEAVVTHRRALLAGAAPEFELRRGLGVAYLEIGLLEDAERESMEALRFDPDDVVSVLTLGQVHLRRGDGEAAERMWAKAREIAPNVPAVERTIQDAVDAVEATE